MLGTRIRSVTALLTILIGPALVIPPGAESDALDPNRLPASYEGRTTAFWRSQMQWSDYACSRFAHDYPLYLNPDSRALPVLLDLLCDDYCKVQLTALTCIRRLGQTRRRAVPAICRLLEAHRQGNLPPRPDDDHPGIDRDSVVIYAIDTLADLGAEAKFAVPTLTKLLTDTDYSIRMCAAKALWEVTGNRELTLQAAVDAIENTRRGQTVPTEAVELIGHIGTDSQEVIDLLAGVLQYDRDRITRYTAAVALGKCGKAAVSAVPALARALEDEDFVVRYKATIAIWAIGHERHLVIPAVLRKLKEERDLSETYCEVLRTLRPPPREILAALEEFSQRRDVLDIYTDHAKEVLASLRGK